MRQEEGRRANVNSENTVLAPLLQAALPWCLPWSHRSACAGHQHCHFAAEEKGAQSSHSWSVVDSGVFNLKTFFSCLFFLGWGWGVGEGLRGKCMLLKFFLHVILKNFKLQKNCKNNAISQILSLLAFCHICTLSIYHNFANPFENYLETLY